MAQIIDGKALAERIRAQVRADAARLSHSPGLAVVLLGDAPATRAYMASKEKDCRECGFRSFEYRLPADTSQEDLLSQIEALNRDGQIDGILIQMPLPSRIDPQAVLMAVDPEKDVDGVHPLNMGRLSLGETAVAPCTPAGVMEMLHTYKIPVRGRQCVVVGRSNVVGKPMASLLLQEDGTVTVCHTRTRNLAEITRSADILVSAAGYLNLITAGMVKDGTVVIDVAMNRTPEGKWRGDVDFDAVAKKASYITPVPGGVGPVTRAMLLRNLLFAAQRKEK